MMSITLIWHKDDDGTLKASTEDNFNVSVTSNPHFGKGMQDVWVKLDKAPLFSCVIFGEVKAQLVCEHIIDSARWRLKD